MERKGREVLITSAGVCLPGAPRVEDLYRRLRQRTPGFTDRTEDALPMGKNEPGDGGELAEFISPEHYERYPRDVQHYLTALIRAHRGTSSALVASRTSLHDGTSRGPFLEWAQMAKPQTGRSETDIASSALGQAASFGAIALGIEGLVETINASCCSGLAAVRSAMKELRSSDSDVAYAGGHEACLGPEYLSTYDAAHLLRRDGFHAYDGNNGTIFGEGAAVLRLERAQSEGTNETRDVLGSILAVRLENHAQHPTNVERRAEGLRPLIQRTLNDANVSAKQVRAVVGHGNGVKVSDALEKRSIAETFPHRPELISNKPIVSHTIAASGVVNVLHATMPEFADDPRRPYVLCLSLGIGGHQAAALVRPGVRR